MVGRKKAASEPPQGPDTVYTPMCFAGMTFLEHLITYSINHARTDQV